MAAVDPVTRREKTASLRSMSAARTARGAVAARGARRSPGCAAAASRRCSSCCRCCCIFGAFSWYPIVRTVIMSLQHTNLVQPATWVGLDNFRDVLHDPLLPIAVKNTA